MRNIWIIARREYNHYFASPIAYVLIAVTLFVLGGFFYLDILYGVQSQQYVPTPDRTLQLLAFPMLFFAVPALTMRTIAEENRNGTLEILFTSPVSDSTLVIGKWLGSFLFFLTLILITWIYPLILNSLVSPGIDQGLLVTGYLGIVLLTSTLCAIGVAVSSFFDNMIASFFATFGVTILFWVISSPGDLIQGPVGTVFKYLSITDHFFTNMLTGVIRVDDIIFYISFTVFALVLGSVSVEMRRWR